MIRYALHHPQERDGEFMFLTSTQSHFAKKESTIRKELEKYLDPDNADFEVSTKDGLGWRKPTRKELIDEMGGIPKIYKLEITELK